MIGAKLSPRLADDIDMPHFTDVPHFGFLLGVNFVLRRVRGCNPSVRFPGPVIDTRSQMLPGDICISAYFGVTEGFTGPIAGLDSLRNFTWVSWQTGEVSSSGLITQSRCSSVWSDGLFHLVWPNEAGRTWPGCSLRRKLGHSTESTTVACA